MSLLGSLPQFLGVLMTHILQLFLVLDWEVGGGYMLFCSIGSARENSAYLWELSVLQWCLKYGWMQNCEQASADLFLRGEFCSLGVFISVAEIKTLYNSQSNVSLTQSPFLYGHSK